MNCPSRTDELDEHDGWNQNPPSLSGDLTTRNDLNGIANLRLQRDHLPIDDNALDIELNKEVDDPLGVQPVKEPGSILSKILADSTGSSEKHGQSVGVGGGPSGRSSVEPNRPTISTRMHKLGQVLVKFSKFIGPGFMVSVAYIDPGNYSTDVDAGASTGFQLLFIVLLSNMFAIVLQSLAVRLGTVTGLNLAEHCRAHLPRWLNYVLYIFAESAIIATDIAEVIGSAIALNLLLKIPLVAGCALTIVDTLLILFLYNPNGSMRRIRLFEYFVMALVLAVVICFCIQLSYIENTSVGEVFKGYLPSSAIIDGSGLYLSCGILGATVMPHSLYLGSGMCQARLREFDEKAELHISDSDTSLPQLEPESTRQAFAASTNTHNLTHTLTRNTIPDRPRDDTEAPSEKLPYRPSLAAICSCLSYSVTELTLSLCIFALFVNSAILIVAGASLSNNADGPPSDLFGIYTLLSSSLAPAAGTIFALALLLSGTSAGIICTIAGQMVSEGALNWTIAPWARRLLTRSISIVPSIVIAGAVGQEGLSKALNGTQVALSVILPFVSAPLVYFTCRNRYMTVGGTAGIDGDRVAQPGVGMRNHWIMSAIAVGVWLTITIMNVALLVLLGLGR
ncbi:hypothetical protein MMC30_003538 [Trapelia coarctata]|nr:hypothetical protein [Trapelia coarctata]